MHRISELAIFCFLVTVANAWRPCPELSPALRFPCRCNVEPIAPNGQLGAVAMDCDRVVFAGDFPPLPASAPIISYTQKYAGQQSLPSQVIFIVFFA